MGTDTTRRSRARAIALAFAVLLAVVPATALAFDPALEAKNFAKTSERERLITKTPEFQKLLAEKEVENNLENAEIQTTDPERNPYGNVCWSRNRECAGDVRYYDWAKDGFGIRTPVLFTARSGATISGNVWATADGPAKRPALVITTGSVQAPETLYWGTAAVLAKHGYVVLTYDVQGQGRSDTFGVGPDMNESVPSQAGQPFYDGTEDALDFLLSNPGGPYDPRPSCGNAAGGTGTDHSDKQERRVGAGFNAAFNPLHGYVDASRVGIAGHSLGAAGVSYIGQLDPRVDAIAAWDNLRDSSAAPTSGGPRPPSGAPGCPSGSSQRPATVPLTKPAIGFSNDYGITPAPNTTDPDPLSASEDERGYEAAGVDSMQVIIRGGTHEEYAFIPGQTVPALGLASYRGMDMATWYTTAWFDRYVKCEDVACRREADRRLLTDRWRDDAAGGQIDSNADPNLFSFYLRSRYQVTTADGATVACTDMRTGCPSMGPDGLPPGYFAIADAYSRPDGQDGGGGGVGGGGGQGGGGSDAPPCSLAQLGTDFADTPATLPATDAGDSIRGRGGNDRIRGLRGADCLFGDRGDDVMRGDEDDDSLAGGAGADRLRGGDGDDRVRGNQGRDSLDAEPGDDRLSGGGGGDRIEGGLGRDLVNGGNGRDRIDTRNGGRDVVRCGRGRDRAAVDAADRVAKDCEVVETSTAG